MRRRGHVELPRMLIRGTLCLIAVVAFAGVGGLGSTGDAVAAPKRAKKPRQKPLPPWKADADPHQVLDSLRTQLPATKSTRSFDSKDLDTQLERELAKAGVPLAGPIDDATFLRRVYLDLTGRLPTPAATLEFSRDTRPGKRSEVIDSLLATDEYARNWARYWRDVVLFRSAAAKNQLDPQALEDWFVEQFKQDVGWDRITAELLIADGKEKEIGPNNFMIGAERKPERMAAETARVFMGINVQCAECHDHPFDRWKRTQFHEMAAFFARGKYFMPDLDDPANETEMEPRFLLGETPPFRMRPNDKRVVVAAYLIYNPDNYWFARAYVNRVWNELLGDGFYSVDSLGPDNDVTYKLVVNRLAAVFRYQGQDFRPSWLFRTIMNSKAYQREARTPRSSAELFGAVRPTRLRGEQVTEAVVDVLGPIPPASKVAETFAYDPSLPQQDVEGSIQQALLLMNNPAVQGRITNGALVKRLARIKSPEECVMQLYLGVLRREPTARELERALMHLDYTSNRKEAIEDLIWVLVNSTEFLTKR